MWWRMILNEEKNGPSYSNDDGVPGRMPTWNEIINGIITENKLYIENKYKHKKDIESTPE